MKGLQSTSFAQDCPLDMVREAGLPTAGLGIVPDLGQHGLQTTQFGFLSSPKQDSPQMVPRFMSDSGIWQELQPGQRGC